MIETWGEGYEEPEIKIITEFDDHFTGLLKIHEVKVSHGFNLMNKFDPILNQPFSLSNVYKFIILQEVEEKFLFFFTRKKFVPLTQLKEFSHRGTIGSMTIEGAKKKIKEVQEEHKAILREVRLKKILSK